VDGPARDLHSSHGGTVYEPLEDLIFLMNSLKSDGEISIPGINDQVVPLKPEERELYKSIDFSMTELHKVIGSQTTLFSDENNTLLHRFVLLDLT
jgi:Cys-Gly metallodipeptidase DUG1